MTIFRRKHHIVCLLLSTLFLQSTPAYASKAKPNKSAEKSKIKVTTNERLQRLNKLLNQFKEMKIKTDKAWDKEIASNQKLRDTNEGFWNKHRQRKAIDSRCREIEYKIRKLKSKETTEKKNKND